MSCGEDACGTPPLTTRLYLPGGLPPLPNRCRKVPENHSGASSQLL